MWVTLEEVGPTLLHREETFIRYQAAVAWVFYISIFQTVRNLRRVEHLVYVFFYPFVSCGMVRHLKFGKEKTSPAASYVQSLPIYVKLSTQMIVYTVDIDVFYQLLPPE